jgi:iron complex transport system substrate-binding protein
MRVAALLPAATDIVIALGAAERLVAVTHACTLPAYMATVPPVTRSRVPAAGAAAVDQAVVELSSAGVAMFDLDEAQLAASHPDILLTQAVCDVCAVNEAHVRTVAARLDPAPRVLALGAHSVDGVLADVIAVGSAMDIRAEAEELVAGMRARMRSVHQALAAAKAPRPRVVVLEWTEPPFGAGHWVPDIIRRAGGEELIGRIGQPSRRIDPAVIRGLEAEVVVVAPCGYTLAEAVTETKAVAESVLGLWMRGKRLWAVDANRLVSSPGPSVIRAIEVVAQILHPELFGQPSRSDAILIA